MKCDQSPGNHSLPIGQARGNKALVEHGFRLVHGALKLQGTALSQTVVFELPQHQGSLAESCCHWDRDDRAKGLTSANSWQQMFRIRDIVQMVNGIATRSALASDLPKQA